jgi:hypothetical protein
VDTITGAGHIDFGDKSVFLVGQDASAEYATIQSGATAASDGDIVLVGTGVYTENVTVTGKAITIEGVGRGVGDNTELDGTITFSGQVDGAAKVADLILNAAGQAVGISVTASSDAFKGSFTLDNVLVENAQNNGFTYVRQGNGSHPTLSDTLGGITIENSEFAHNAQVDSGAAGDGDILIFGFNQDLTISGVSIHDAGAAAEKAIQIRGNDNVVNAGTFNLNHIGVTGSYLKDLIAIVNYAGFTAFNASDFNLNAIAPWGLIHLDGVGGTVDLSHLDGINPGGIIGAIEDRASDDTIFGTAGNDVFSDNLGADHFDGGKGDDTFFIANPLVHDAGESINGGEGTDTILFVDTTDNDKLNLFNVTNVEHVTIGDALGATTGTHALDIDGSSLTTGVTLTGNNGNNNLTGGAGDDKIFGNDGNDTLDGRGGSNELHGGKGDDTYFVHSSNDEIFENASQGHDTVYSTAASYELAPNVEDLFLEGTGNIDGTGNSLANTIVGNDGNNTIDGKGGIDHLDGGKGDDHLIGGTAGDTLHGGMGDDTLTGGTGPDTYQFDSYVDGHDTIADFDGDNDNLSFKASLDLENNGVIDDLNAMISNIKDDGAGTDVVVTFTGGLGSITLQGANVIHGDHSDGKGGFDISTLVADPSQITTHS